LFLSPRHIVRSAIIIKPSTLLRFHKALNKRKYRLLFSPGGGRKPGPKGPAKEIIDAIVEMDQYTRRIIGFGVHAGNVDGQVLCRMFNDATSKQIWPTYLSSDNDPLFQYHRWKANLRVLDIEEIKSLPHVPMSHPFVERLIGSIRRELLDHTLFWTATDLENKLREYQCYYNERRTHSGRKETTPVNPGSANVIDINKYRWQNHCRGLFQLPMAA
jgi:putative transposase